MSATVSILADAATGYDVGTLTTTLTDAAQTALPYFGAGIAAGAVVLGVTWGIRKAMGFMRTVGGK